MHIQYRLKRPPDQCISAENHQIFLSDIAASNVLRNVFADTSARTYHEGHPHLNRVIYVSFLWELVNQRLFLRRHLFLHQFP